MKKLDSALYIDISLELRRVYLNTISIMMAMGDLGNAQDRKEGKGERRESQENGSGRMGGRSSRVAPL